MQPNSSPLVYAKLTTCFQRGASVFEALNNLDQFSGVDLPLELHRPATSLITARFPWNVFMIALLRFGLYHWACSAHLLRKGQFCFPDSVNMLPPSSLSYAMVPYCNHVVDSLIEMS